MSADRWSSCPKCLKETQDEHDAKEKAVMDSYGKVSIEEFDAAREALPPRPVGYVESGEYVTFREDYSFEGVEEGDLNIRYNGRCSTCGLSTEFREKLVFWREDEE